MLGRLLRLFIVIMLLGVVLRYVLGKQQQQTFGYWINCLALILLLVTLLMWLLYALKTVFW
ncbi:MULTISPECIES: hypothetical protein [Snodgrassella]|uniref:protein MIGRI n=1 Tax=Snodgrassella TaxID=1193515 RepID=UPI001EF5C386|nr:MULTISPECIES: hypothetical protein [Snodgrassella]MCO6525299.1 hypothetical protein [Snodgrassella sp.]